MFKCENTDCNQTFEYAGEVRQMALTPVNTPEITKTWRACPYCFSKRIVEIPKEDKLNFYDDWKQVQHIEVADYLKEGYGVISHTKDSVVIAKPKTIVNKDLNQIFKEGIREAKLQEVAHQ